MTRHVPKPIPNAQVPGLAHQRATHRVALALGIVSVLALSLILATWQHVEALRYGYRLNQLVRERERLEALKRQLESERAYYRSPQVIEPLARQLGLIRPDPSQVIVIGRGSAAAPARAFPESDLSAHPVKELIGERTSPSEPRVSGARAESSPVRRRERRAQSVASDRQADVLKPESAPLAGESRSENGIEPSPKAVEPQGGALTEEKPTDSEAQTSKRRRPSKQGEP